MENLFDLISNTADGALAVDREQKIVLWNEAAEKLFGFKAEEVLGRYCYEVIGGRNESGRLVCRAHCLTMTMALRQQLIPTCDVLACTKAGREACWLSLSTVLVPSRRRDLFVLVHLFRDVSRQKEMERFVHQLLSSVPKLSLSQGTHLRISPPLPPTLMDLTGREREVLCLLASGASTKAIAKQLFISPFTVRNHIYNILAKLGAHSRLEAVTLCMRSGLL